MTADPCPAQIRLAFIAPSGSGKSSALDALRDRLATLGLRVTSLKLAEPLYRLQGSFYATAGRQIAEKAQDQVLLETIATQLRRIDPAALIRDFERRLHQCQADVVLNDDLRDDVTDGPRLRALGFRTVRIVTAETERLRRLTGRQDPTVVECSPLDRQIARIPADFVLCNSAGPEVLSRQIAGLAAHLVTAAPSSRGVA